MFILSTIEDLVQVAPEVIGRPSAQYLKDAINTKYANKIVQKVGMCICLFDILQTSQGLIGHGTGLVNVNVEFRMVVFRPFRGEILYGSIKTSNEDGIVIDVDFHNEIFIPFQNLFPNCSFDQSERTWIWKAEGGAELFFDRGEPVLFRVEQEEWFDQKPSVQEKDSQGNLIVSAGTAWRVIGSMNQSGLGPTLWWEEAAEEVGEEGAEGEEDGDVEMEDMEEE